jgi:hypothetical protein
MFGAHRASSYGTTKATKTSALTASAKDQVRESHARELTCRHPRPKILDEVFHKYQQLLDNAEVEPTPLTLPDLPAPRVAPSISRQKRGGGSRVEEEYNIGTSGGNKRLPAVTMSRETAMTAFIETPFFPGVSQLRVDHITALLASL